MGPSATIIPSIASKTAAITEAALKETTSCELGDVAMTRFEKRND